eukprot:TRINITY_DN4935_c0_g2_i5.p1 TRINITY_DN4935_c0_g2~~TRINITY_DN4935_c0_g2_i5.p1  ORF type:complete len:893 (+),score=210.75 TRINITY_DN4935_c0_g2_i5:44-2680(+)
MAAPVLRCHAALVQYLKRDGDSALTLLRKFYLLMLSIFFCVTAALVQTWNLAHGTTGALYDPNERFSFVGPALIYFAQVMGGVYLLVFRRCTESTYVIVLVLTLLGSLIFQFAKVSTIATDTGFAVIPIFDLLLMGRVDKRACFAIVAFVCAWRLALALEATYRFGWFDIPGTEPYDVRTKVCECEAPPCPTRDIPNAGSLRVEIFNLAAIVYDFYVTRMFAAQATSRGAHLHTLVSVMQDVAQHLADFNLDEAERGLRQAQHTHKLPRDLSRVFEVLLGNLRSYRPFLPDALFTDAAKQLCVLGDSDRFTSLDLIASDEVKVRLPPALRSSRSMSTPPRRRVVIREPDDSTKEASLVAVSVLQADELKRKSAGNASDVAFAMYNTLVRDAISTHDGQLVNAIGESFLIAFVGALKAVRFASSVQISVHGNEWPVGLSRGVVGDGFPHFAVQIGVGTGTVTVRSSDPEGCPYTGPAVDAAVHAAALGGPGVVTVTGPVLRDCAAQLHDFFILPHAATVSAAARGEPPAQGVSDMTVLIAKSQVPEHLRAVLDCATPHALGGGEPTLSFPLPSPTAGESQGSVAVVKLLAWDCVDWAGGDTLSSYGDALASSCDALSARLALLHAAATQTGGVLTTVLSSTVVGSWNAHRPCPDHVPRSMEFMQKLHAALLPSATRGEGSGGPPLFHAGLATGLLPSGLLMASPQQSFITLLGACVDLSVMLCTAAAELDTSLLVAAADGSMTKALQSHPAVGARLRPIDRWSFTRTTGDRSCEVLVSEGCVGALPVSAGNEAAGPWSADYAAAFAASDISRLQEWARSDAVVVQVCALLGGGRHLSHAFMTVRQHGTADNASVTSAADTVPVESGNVLLFDSPEEAHL